jgi:hypothetical protein
MNIIVNFEGRPATAASYVIGRIVDGIETVTDNEIRLTVRRAVTDINPKVPCKGNVMVGSECHRLDAPYTFKVTRAGDVTNFKRRRGK